MAEDQKTLTSVDTFLLIAPIILWSRNLYNKFCDLHLLPSCEKKAEHLYCALHGIQTTLQRSGMDHTVLPAINTMPALPHKRSPDGATTD